MPYTAKQEQAIYDQNKDILVSASAGSGKTTVLVKRVLTKILNGTSVDQLLIVTFTKAAAGEMKQRIKNELLKKLKEDSVHKSYLKQQLNLVDTANISTIDAFCLDVIHRFYYVIDQDPSFSILTDETQAQLLKEKALKDTEIKFLNQDDVAFKAFYQNFAGDRDVESGRELLLDLYNFAMTKPDYLMWLNSLEKSYQIDSEIVKSALWQKQIKPYLLTTFLNEETKVTQLLESEAIQNKELAKVNESFQLFDQNLHLFIEALKQDRAYDDLRSLIKACIFSGNYRKSKKWDEDLLEFYEESQTLKNDLKKLILETYSSFFAVEEAKQIAAIQKAQTIVAAIVSAEKALINRFSQLKRAENLIDYSDMEQFAYQILAQDTSQAAVARSFYQNKFKEILVDEYQDINPLQEKIIQTIKKDGQNNLFMVGDVKQSIYGFRQAAPDLFLKKYHDFGQSDSDKQERIVLQDNFRSTEAVTKTVNHLFNPLLTSDFGGIDYQKEGQLVFGAKYYPDDLASASEVIYHENHAQETLNEDNDQVDFAEIQMVIKRIQQFKAEKLQVFDAKLGHKRPLKYSDIAILTRSRSNNLEIMKQFAQFNLPLFVTDAQNYFQTFELTIILDYLKIIDNPDQDIPLVAVLRSPIFNFKEKELAKIRINRPNTSFYQALLAYVANGDELSNKIKDFLNQLELLRKFANTHRISELIWSIYEKTNLLEIMTALPNGKQRRVNLEALYERASSYESAGFKGLYQFVNFINRMRRANKDLAQPLLSQEAGDSVRLMTIHGSKGLEFPIVFCVGLEHHYQMRDLSANYVITNQTLGLSVKEEDYQLDTLVKAFSNVSKKRQLLEEEARILYVALTRAKQKLILVADIKNLTKKIQTWQKQLTNKNTLSLADKLNVTSPLAFIGPSLAIDKHLPQKLDEISEALDISQDKIYIKFDQELTLPSPETKKGNDAEENDVLTKTTKKLFEFKYPFEDATKTTAYQAVSEIKKAFNDPIDKDLENSHLIASSNRYLQAIETHPDFLFAKKFTGAEIGTATHLILQYYDYQTPKDQAKQKLDAEIQDLITAKKLNPNIVSHLKLDQMIWFVTSDFAERFYENPENLKREVDFSSLLSAKMLFKDFSDPAAKILVHGTIDGYYVSENGIILFDYKTDHIDQSHLELAIKKIKAKYLGQLRLYEQALNDLSEKKVIHKYLILLDVKQVVEL